MRLGYNTNGLAFHRWTEAIEMLTYDPRKKAYRCWGFFSNGLIKEMTGAWDEKAKTLTWKGADPESGIHAVWKMTFRDKDNRETTLVVKDKAGKICLDVSEKLTRQK